MCLKVLSLETNNEKISEPSKHQKRIQNKVWGSKIVRKWDAHTPREKDHQNTIKNLKMLLIRTTVVKERNGQK